VTLFDLLGNSICSGEIAIGSSTAHLDLDDLVKGIYMVRVASAGVMSYSKIIVE
jgi:hypothetical protein